MNISNTYKQLVKPRGPWALIAISPEEEIDSLIQKERQKKATTVHIVRGHRCATKASLFNEWAAALQFPAYFGGNWDAFEDCLNDLGWLNGSSHIIAVTNVDRILTRSRSEWRTFVEILHAAAEEWHSRKGMLRVIFHVEPGGEEKLRARFQQISESLG
jgi:RNAse (barnase) inhibitor barstar